jgi:hypothetical protein
MSQPLPDGLLHATLLLCSFASFPTFAGQCPGAGSCCAANGSPGCSNTACCNLVCVNDPFCCAVEWDSLCAESACAQCTVCDCFPACTLTCQPGNAPEAEPCGSNTNGGCNVTPPVFGAVLDGQTICGSAWASAGNRDSDWFLVDASNLATAITANLTSEFSGVCYVLQDVDTCEPVILGELGASAGCAVGPRARAVVPPGQYAVFVATAGFDGVPCGTSNDYRVAVTIKCIGDTDETGVVDVLDLINVVLMWNTSGQAPGIDADVNDDEGVDVTDLSIVIRDWGQCLVGP